MTLSSLTQRHRKSGAKLTSIALAVALVSQIALSTVANAKPVDAGPPPSANLDQCGNGPTATPVPCTGSNWQNGNLNSNNSHYAEGQSAPYRVVMENLPTTGTLTLVIEYDITNSSKHAIDYLTSFDRTEATADPCSGVTGCSLSGTAAFPAPSSAGSPVTGQPATSFNALPSGERALSLYNAAIAGTGVTYVSEGSLTAAQSSTQVQIQFTASQSTVVFAWGGHIGAASDWGTGNSAGGISGSPYHMRLVSLTGANLGNQDRSLSADAVTAATPTTGTLTVIKHVINDNGGTAVASDFTMNVTGTNVSTSSFPGSETGTAVTLDAGSYSVAEDAATGYTVSYSDGCSGTMTADGSATCTVTNDDIAPPPEEGPTDGTLTVVKVVINDDSGTKQVSDFPLFVGQTQVTSGQSNSFEPGSYSVSETSDAGYVASFSGDCDASGIVSLEAGDEKTCTITNDDVRHTDGGGGGPSTGLLIVVTNVVNDDGGSAIPASFLMTVTSASPSVFAGQGTPGMSLSTLPGAYSVDGSNDPGYAKSAGATCTGTLSANQTVTCVITYDDLPAAGGEPTPPPTPPTPPETPTPEVLGVTDSATGPVPMVLGATDEDLPVTGMPAWALVAFLLPAVPFLRRKRA